MLLVLLDERELALQYIQSAARSVNLGWSMLLPAMDPIRCDARFRTKVEALKVKDLRAAKLCT